MLEALDPDLGPESVVHEAPAGQPAVDLLAESDGAVHRGGVDDRAVALAMAQERGHLGERG